MDVSELKLPVCQTCGAMCTKYEKARVAAGIGEDIRFSCGSAFFRSSNHSFKQEFPETELTPYGSPGKWKKVSSCNAEEIVRRLRSEHDQ